MHSSFYRTVSQSARLLLFVAPWAICPGFASAQTNTTTFVELSRRTETVDGKQLIAIRVRPPTAPVAPATPAPAPVAAPSPINQLEEMQRAAKKQSSFTVSATVYPGPLTELRWNAAGRDWLAYSNVDFNALTQLPMIETADAVYLWFPMVSAGDAESRPRPPGLVFSCNEAEYLVYARQAEWEAAPEAFVVLDWLHSYYEEHRSSLDIALAMRRAEEARRAAEPPPPPKPHIVRYYMPASPTPSAPSPQKGGAK